MDSDTESEFDVECSSYPPHSMLRPDPDLPQDEISSLRFRASVERYLGASEQNQDLRQTQDTILSYVRHHRRIETTAFQRESKAQDHDEDPRVVLQLLYKEAFLTRLFDNRKLARIQYHPPHPNEMARPTLWEDNLLVLMIDAFATLLHCDDVPNAAAMPEGIRVQLQDEKLRAASNLPDSWSCVPEVLSSPAAAAVKRFGLLLTFGVYLSALFAEPWDPWCKSEATGRIAPFLRDFIASSGERHLQAEGRCDCGLAQRCHNAMVLVLLANSEDYVARGEQTPFRPHTNARLLALIDCALGCSTGTFVAGAPIIELDPAQRILVDFGRVVSWAWELWQDARIAGAETVVTLTATWMLLQPSPGGLQISTSHTTGQQVVLLAYAIINLLRHNIASLSRNADPCLAAAPALAILRGVWLLIETLDNMPPGAIHCELATGIGSSMCCLWGRLGDDALGLAYQELVVRFFCLVDTNSARGALEKACTHPSIRMAEGFDAELSAMTKFLLGMDPTGLPESALHRIRVILQMLAVVFQSSTSKSLPLPHCASFLQTLLKGCLQLAHAWPTWEAIAGSLLTTLACLELSKDRFALIQKTWSDEGIWKSMRSPMLLVSAAAYASHVFATARGNTVRDTDAYVRAWDMLGRQLLRVLSGEIAPDEQAIGVVCAPLLCAALCALAAPLDAMGSAAGYMFGGDDCGNGRVSGVTLRLRNALDACLQDDSMEQFASTLRGRLRMVGAALLAWLTDHTLSEQFLDEAKLMPFVINANGATQLLLITEFRSV